MLRHTRAFAGFSVDDLGKAQKFYANVLGLRVTRSPEGLVLHLRGSGDVFVYHSTDYRAPDHTVLNFVVADVEAALATLAKKGVEPEHYDLPGIVTDAGGVFRNDSGMGPDEIAWFKDPAGHILSVLTERVGKATKKRRAAARQAPKRRGGKRPARTTRRK